ncbi:hypothetical protein SteCoe_37881 [Stentor coeruleus]|uniref:Kinesin-like protein n=1 Tax=Stentor coeruleus TaxID=5963 RepID=A0A1R2AM79_9CILI|nr:hypothetical protein SteCoe_37881 [Stentor coeruleus]
MDRTRSMKFGDDEPETKGNVTVVCRFRPLNQKEKDMNDKPCVDFGSDGKTVVVKSQYENQGPQTFNFDIVFNPDSTQNSVYEGAAKPIVESVLEGFNGTVLTYGQTSSGKTHTMTGPDMDDINQKGIIPRMVKTVFSHIENCDDTLEFAVKVAYCEIYLEKIRDLLKPEKNNLKISEDKARGIYIVDLTEEYVSNEDEVYGLMKMGQKNREVGFTNMNEGSSRSHAIFSLTVSQTNTRDLSAKSGKLYLVDLAGSEKVGKTGAEGKRLDEAKNINKSLSTLGLVIFSLTDGKSTHVPYRDSKLTRVLQDSLGGNSKTMLIITCSPASYNEAETVSTLRFGIRAKAVKNKPKVNKEYSVAELKLLLSQANELINKKDTRIIWLEKHFIEIGGTIPADIEGEELKEETLASTQEYQEVMGILESEKQKLVDEMELTASLKQEISIYNAKNDNLLRENENLNSKLMDLIFTMNEIEDKLNDSKEECLKVKAKGESQEKQIKVLEDSLKFQERKIEEQNQEISRIPIEFIPVAEKEHLLKEIKELKIRYNAQEEILKASYTKILDETNESFKDKFAEKFSGNTPNFQEMAHFLELERESWTTEHKNLLSDLENKKSIIEELENDKEQSRLVYEELEKNRAENDQKLKDKVNNLEKNLEQLTVSYQVLGTKYQNSKSEIKIREGKILQCRDKINKMEKIMRKQAEEINELKAKLEQLEAVKTGKTGEPTGRAGHAKIKKGIKGGGGNSRVRCILNMNDYPVVNKPTPNLD